MLVLHALQHMVGTRGHLEARLELAIDQFAAAMVQVVIIRVDRQHLLFSAGADSVCVQCCGAQRFGKRQKRPKGDRSGQNL
jgi:hypothetical protein